MARSAGTARLGLNYFFRMGGSRRWTFVVRAHARGLLASGSSLAACPPPTGARGGARPRAARRRALTGPGAGGGRPSRRTRAATPGCTSWPWCPRGSSCRSARRRSTLAAGCASRSPPTLTGRRAARARTGSAWRGAAPGRPAGRACPGRANRPRPRRQGEHQVERGPEQAGAQGEGARGTRPALTGLGGRGAPLTRAPRAAAPGGRHGAAPALARRHVHARGRRVRPPEPLHDSSAMRHQARTGSARV